MSGDNVLTGDCPRCGGSFEFAAQDAGKVAECPHCGRVTELIPRAAQSGKPKSFRPLTVSLLLIVAILGLVGFVLHSRPGKRPRVANAPVISAGTAENKPAAAVPFEKPKLPPETETDDFAISPVKLEKTPGSSLVYVIGKLRNLSGLTRYGVKLEFGLSDTNHEPVGVATDYHQTLEPYGEWNFRAMVLESKAVSAHFRSVREDQ
jgi:hypothetical protein